MENLGNFRGTKNSFICCSDNLAVTEIFKAKQAYKSKTHWESKSTKTRDRLISSGRIVLSGMSCYAKQSDFITYSFKDKP